MFFQGGGDSAAVQRQRHKAGGFCTKVACLFDGSARNQHLIPGRSEAPRYPSAESAIAAKKYYARHRMRRACSVVGIQQVDRLPNSR